jgi:hypothetical protein
MALNLSLGFLHFPMFCSLRKKRGTAGRGPIFLCHPDRSGGISRRQARFFCLLHAAVLPFMVDALDQGDLFLPLPSLELPRSTDRGSDLAGVLANPASPQQSRQVWLIGGARSK